MLFLEGSKHTIVEIPHCSVVPFAVTVGLLFCPIQRDCGMIPFPPHLLLPQSSES